ncbi:Gp49 family protein [Achromobacter sp. SIMBA_011]|uniref:Gp49 family protein n=2 Tax=Bacteria TaxID=2 RepID=UPI00397DEC87
MHNIASPRTDDVSFEQQIQSKGKTAPRVTPADIEANIAAELCFTVGNAADALGVPTSDSTRLLTICVLTLRNGFTVSGESACASPENFDTEIGRNIARQNAVQKIWPLMGYALRTELSRPVLTEADAAADLAGTSRPPR